MTRALIFLSVLGSLTLAGRAQADWLDDSPQTKAFARIAGGDYRREYVLRRDADTTTFLDIDDPAHPNTHATDAGSSRVHILVIPNQRNGAIGRKQIIAKAKLEAAALGIKHVDVYVNRGLALHASWLHAHIEGTRARGYSPKL